MAGLRWLCGVTTSKSTSKSMYIAKREEEDPEELGAYKGT